MNAHNFGSIRFGGKAHKGKCSIRVHLYSFNLEIRPIIREMRDKSKLAPSKYLSKNAYGLLNILVRSLRRDTTNENLKLRIINEVTGSWDESLCDSLMAKIVSFWLQWKVEE